MSSKQMVKLNHWVDDFGKHVQKPVLYSPDGIDSTKRDQTCLSLVTAGC